MKNSRLSKSVKQWQERKARRVAGIPSIGIFWVVGKRLLIDSTPVAKAEDYADFKIHGADHYTIWEKFKQMGEVAQELEYDDVPRGRVMYNPKTDKYLLLADRCILKNPSLLNRIEAKMNLPDKKTDLDSDAHYRCPKCLQNES